MSILREVEVWWEGEYSVCEVTSLFFFYLRTQEEIHVGGTPEKEMTPLENTESAPAKVSPAS